MAYTQRGHGWVFSVQFATSVALQSANEINANCCHMPEICICICEYVPSRSPRFLGQFESLTIDYSVLLASSPNRSARQSGSY